jgi:hypothetical protein
VGLFTETVDGVPHQYRYTLELSQQGNFVAGKSTLEKEDDTTTFARFVIRGQVTAGPTLKIVEDLLTAQKLLSGSAAGPRTTEFSYFSSEGQDLLEGEWADRRQSTQAVTGTVMLVKQP